VAEQGSIIVAKQPHQEVLQKHASLHSQIIFNHQVQGGQEIFNRYKYYPFISSSKSFLASFSLHSIPCKGNHRHRH
jgi:hypothetical protein